jgi:hypothetical protein
MDEVITTEKIKAALRARNRGGQLHQLSRAVQEQGFDLALTNVEDFAYGRGNVEIPLPMLQAIVFDIWGFRTTIEDGVIRRIENKGQPAIPLPRSTLGALPKPAPWSWMNVKQPASE